MSGGPAKAAKDVLKVTALPMYAGPKAAFDLITKGKNPIRSVGESIGGAAESAMHLATPGLEGAGLVSNEELPNIAVEDPAAKADADKKNRARVKRQAEIDILTDRPGRGGTILTDKYTYNV